ncbi:MAG: hypothetical protein Q7T55_23175 [Solirubrobacteraceae bacterium]|nr:hypothetical protein [Solirubrobacteraceae bacterium]
MDPGSPVSRRVRWRRRIGTTIAVVVSLFVVAVVLFFGYTIPVRWEMVGAGTDGHSLVVVIRDDLNGCSPEPRIRVSASNERRITIKARVRAFGGCGNKDLRLFAPETVDVRVPLEGQEIVGSKKGEPSESISVFARDYVAPRLIGLAPEDVTAIARATGFVEVEVPPNVVSVESQEPAAGTRRSNGSSTERPSPLRLTWVTR